jgi:hypothetical protein
LSVIEPPSLRLIPRPLPAKVELRTVATVVRPLMPALLLRANRTFATSKVEFEPNSPVPLSE